MKALPLLVLLHVGDLHSTPDAYPALVAEVDAVLADNRGVPARILIGGDVFEHGDPIAEATKGEAGYALIRALSRRAPVIWVLGNHDADLEPFETTVKRAKAAGVTVVGTIDQDGRSLAPATAPLPAGLTLVAASTPDLSTYPKALRSRLTIRPPPAMTGPTVVLSHLGVDADRVLSPPKGSIILGAHDHRRIITPTLAHSGAYGEGLTVAKYYARRGLDTDWTTEWRPTGAKRDEALAARLAPLQRHLTANDKRCVGVNQKAMGLKAAAQWAVEQLRQTTGADLAVLNHTSFGSGLPKGPISAYRWRRFLRFDNALKIGPLRAPPADPAGDRDPSAADRDPAARLALSARLHVSAAKSGRFPFRVATSDWVASKADRYFGTGRSGPFEAIGGPRLRARLAARLAPCPP